MIKTRLLILVFAAVLMLVITAAFQVEEPPIGSSDIIYSYAGMGDLRRFEGQPAMPNTGVQDTSVGSVGMGELRRVESLPSVPVTGSLESTNSFAGMGGLRRYESQQ